MMLSSYLLRDERDLGLGRDFDTELAHAHDGARLLTLLTAFLGLALVRADDRDTRELVRHLAREKSIHHQKPAAAPVA